MNTPPNKKFQDQTFIFVTQLYEYQWHSSTECLIMVENLIEMPQLVRLQKEGQGPGSPLFDAH